MFAESAICFACVNCAFLMNPWRPITSGSTEPIFTIFFHQMVGILTYFMDLTFFLIAQGTVPWQPILGKIGKPNSFGMLAFKNG